MIDAVAAKVTVSTTPTLTPAHLKKVMRDRQAQILIWVSIAVMVTNITTQIKLTTTRPLYGEAEGFPETALANQLH
jgi:hypothetical protein